MWEPAYPAHQGALPYWPWRIQSCQRQWSGGIPVSGDGPAPDQDDQLELTAVSTGGVKTRRAVSMMYTVYLSKLCSHWSPCLWSRTRTMQMGLPFLSTPCRKLFPIRTWVRKS